MRLGHLELVQNHHWLSLVQELQALQSEIQFFAFHRCQVVGLQSQPLPRVAAQSIQNDLLLRDFLNSDLFLVPMDHPGGFSTYQAIKIPVELLFEGLENLEPKQQREAHQNCAYHDILG